MKGDDLFKTRQALLDKRQQALINGASDLEKGLFDMIMKQFVQYLVTEKGKIVSGSENIKLTDALDKVFNDFRNKELVKVAATMVDDFAKVTALNENYYELFTSKKKFDDIRKEVREFIRVRIGLNPDNTIKTDGYLDKLISDNTLRNEIKNQTLKAVTGGLEFGLYQEQLRFKIEGATGIDGSLTRYLKTFAYDSYMQFDRTVNTVFADNLELTDFFYAGGLIETSRKFCIERNNKVFTKDEAKLWVNDKDLPRTLAEKKSGIITGYVPEIDMGRFNCRHMARFISRDLAKNYRPDLK